MTDIRTRLVNALREKIMPGHAPWPETYGEIADLVLSLPGITISWTRVSAPMINPLRDDSRWTAHGDTECYEDVTRNGESQPCNKPAAAVRIDPEEGGPYPVCEHHSQGRIVIRLIRPS